MPSSMVHLIVAKKVNPNASTDFYVGNLAPDAIKERQIKNKVHFADAPDMEAALKKFGLKADNDYLKGFLLHLYVDWKWNTTYLSDFINKSDGDWDTYKDEISKVTSYAFHDVKWAYNLYAQMKHWNYYGFVENKFITKDDVKKWIDRSRKWQIENKLESSTAFPPTLIEKFANDTTNEFINWVSTLANFTISD